MVIIGKMNPHGLQTWRERHLSQKVVKEAEAKITEVVTWQTQGGMIVRCWDEKNERGVCGSLERGTAHANESPNPQGQPKWTSPLVLDVHKYVLTISLLEIKLHQTSLSFVLFHCASLAKTSMRITPKFRNSHNSCSSLFWLRGYQVKSRPRARTAG